MEEIFRLHICFTSPFRVGCVHTKCQNEKKSISFCFMILCGLIWNFLFIPQSITNCTQSNHNTDTNMAYQSRSTRIKALAQTGPTMYWPTFSRPPSRQSADINSRHYIDPWDLENYAYIQRWEMSTMLCFTAAAIANYAKEKFCSRMALECCYEIVVLILFNGLFCHRAQLGMGSLEADDQIDGPINIPDSLASPYASSKSIKPGHSEPIIEYQSFCWWIGNVEECPCYAGLDEQLFYNAKYEMLPDDCGFSTITGELREQSGFKVAILFFLE